MPAIVVISIEDLRPGQNAFCPVNGQRASTADIEVSGLSFESQANAPPVVPPEGEVGAGSHEGHRRPPVQGLGIIRDEAGTHAFNGLLAFR